MTEQGFREYLQNNVDYLERISGTPWPPEKIEAAVQRVQEEKRLLASGLLRKEDLGM